MPHPAWEYINSASADEITMRWNREAFERVRLNTRVLVDVSQIDTSTTLLGQRMAHPILLAPTSTHMLAHAEGEVATARGAGAAEATLVVSTLANRTLEDIAKAATHPLWFQLYVAEDRGLTKYVVQRAEDAGYGALCITVDFPYVYARNREERILAQAPALPFPLLGITAGPGGAGKRSALSRKFDWKELEWLRSFAKIPIVLKGILDPADADLAAKTGAAGVVVSNHGGRALDCVPATIAALPRVTDKVAGRIPVLVDGGIRRGTDVLKGLAYGAAAVLVGRPYLYGLGVAGSDGVCDVIGILRAELVAAMALCGRRTIAEIDRAVIW